MVLQVSGLSCSPSSFLDLSVSLFSHLTHFLNPKHPSHSLNSSLSEFTSSCVSCRNLSSLSIAVRSQSPNDLTHGGQRATANLTSKKTIHMTTSSDCHLACTICKKHTQSTICVFSVMAVTSHSCSPVQPCHLRCRNQRQGDHDEDTSRQPL